MEIAKTNFKRAGFYLLQHPLLRICQISPRYMTVVIDKVTKFSNSPFLKKLFAVLQINNKILILDSVVFAYRLQEI